MHLNFKILRLPALSDGRRGITPVAAMPGFRLEGILASGQVSFFARKQIPKWGEKQGAVELCGTMAHFAVFEVPGAGEK